MAIGHAGTGTLWHVTAVRRSNGQEILMQFFHGSMPSREESARRLLAHIDKADFPAEALVRGFGDIARLRMHGLELLSIVRASEVHLQLSPHNAMDSQSELPVA